MTKVDDRLEITKKSSVWKYYLLALIFTWSFWMIGIILGLTYGYTVPVPFFGIILNGFDSSTHVFVAIIFQIGTFGPLIAAFIMTSLEEGKSGVHDLLRRMGKVKIAPKWYGAVVVIPIIISFGALGLSTVLNGMIVPSGVLTIPDPTWAAAPYILYMGLTSGMEEPGWRGYALPRLQNRRNAQNASYLLAIIWAIWHYPFVIYLFMVNMPPTLIATSLIGFTASFLPICVIYTWFYNNTGSVFICIVLHTFTNIANEFIVGPANPFGGVATAGVALVIMFLLLKVFGKERLARDISSNERI